MCATGCRANSPHFAVIKRRSARGTPWRGSAKTTRDGGWARNCSVGRRSKVADPGARIHRRECGPPMNVSTLDILRCPYCGGRLELVTSLFNRCEGDQIHTGVLGCHCCTFVEVEGIPVMHLLEASTKAREHVEAGRPDLARHALLGLNDRAQAQRFDRVAAADAATYREAVDALGPQ